MKINTKTKYYILLSAFLLGVMVIGISGELKAYKVDTSTPPHKEKLKEYSNIKGYIIEQAEKNNLDPMDLFAILICESRLNENAINVNNNGTVDLGISQWNTIHLKSGFIDLKCMADARCSIDKMVEKRLRDGNYSAWVCAKRLNIK